MCQTSRGCVDAYAENARKSSSILGGRGYCRRAISSIQFRDTTRHTSIQSSTESMVQYSWWDESFCNPSHEDIRPHARTLPLSIDECTRLAGHRSFQGTTESTDVQTCHPSLGICHSHNRRSRSGRGDTTSFVIVIQSG